MRGRERGRMGVPKSEPGAGVVAADTWYDGGDW